MQTMGLWTRAEARQRVVIESRWSHVRTRHKTNERTEKKTTEVARIRECYIVCLTGDRELLLGMIKLFVKYSSLTRVLRLGGGGGGWRVANRVTQRSAAARNLIKSQ